MVRKPLISRESNGQKLAIRMAQRRPRKRSIEEFSYCSTAQVRTEHSISVPRLIPLHPAGADHARGDACQLFAPLVVDDANQIVQSSRCAVAWPLGFG